MLLPNRLWNKYSRRTWNGLIWLKTKFRVRMIQKCDERHKRRRICWPAKQLSVSIELRVTVCLTEILRSALYLSCWDTLKLWFVFRTVFILLDRGVSWNAYCVKIMKKWRAYWFISAVLSQIIHCQGIIVWFVLLYSAVLLITPVTCSECYGHVACR